MAITAAGIGSGLDIEGIVTQLMQVERRPLTALQKRESEFRADLSAYGRLKSAISSFKTAMDGLGSLDKFKVFASASTDESVVTAATTGSAAAGTFNLQVTRLAQNHKMGSDAFASTDTFGGAAGDSLTLTVGSSSLVVDLEGAETLTQIRDAINTASGNPGVSAGILNEGGGQQRLILTAQDSGYEKRVQVSYGGAIGAGTFNFATVNQDSGGAALADLTQLDAAFSVDGYAITYASNKVSGVLDGVTLDLKKTGSATLSLTRDTAAIQGAAQSLVDAYNNLTKTIEDLRAGDLSGDGTLLSLQGQLRGVLNTAPGGLTTALRSLSEVGITTDRDTGQLKLDSTRFTSALDSDFSGVAELFADDDQGYAYRFKGLANSLLDIEGLMKIREKTINKQISDLEAKQLDMESRLTLTERHLRSQYAALDSLVGGLQSTSQFLTNNLAALKN